MTTTEELAEQLSAFVRAAKAKSKRSPLPTGERYASQGQPKERLLMVCEACVGPLNAEERGQLGDLLDKMTPATR
jgi:hypothetical protein